MFDTNKDIIFVVLVVGIFVYRAIRDEGEKTRDCLWKIFGQGESDKPTVGDRITWIQWKVNPRPFD